MAFNTQSSLNNIAFIIEGDSSAIMNAILRSLSVILGLDSVIYLAVNGTDTNLPVFIQNIVICVPKTNKAFMGLEQHEGK